MRPLELPINAEDVMCTTRTVRTVLRTLSYGCFENEEPCEGYNEACQLLDKLEAQAQKILDTQV